MQRRASYNLARSPLLLPFLVLYSVYVPERNNASTPAEAAGKGVAHRLEPAADKAWLAGIDPEPAADKAGWPGDTGPVPDTPAHKG